MGARKVTLPVRSHGGRGQQRCREKLLAEEHTKRGLESKKKNIADATW